jgi:RNA-directed DNA polymerase
MCRDIEWREVNEVQIPGNKIAPQWPFLDTLEQDGLCAVCQQRITQLTGWHSHHLVWRTHGGSDRTENRVLLHPNCHAQVHSQGLTVVKPRPQRGVCKA